MKWSLNACRASGSVKSATSPFHTVWVPESGFTFGYNELLGDT